MTNIIRPSEIFITNILSTHLENFKSKKNIANEKSDIFNLKYNNQNRRLYLNINNKFENLVLKKANKEKKLKVIEIAKFSNKYFIEKIISKKNFYQVIFSINKKKAIVETKSIILFRLINLLFCYAFFSQNSIKIDTITKSQKYLKPVDGRGLTHHISIKENKVKIIDESYNANPETMIQSVDYFSKLKKPNNKKILILGSMNELGENSNIMHLNLLKQIDKFKFKIVILCGEFFRRSIKKLIKPNNEFTYISNKKQIMKFLNNNVHNNDNILIKCSNKTEINIFAKDLLRKGS